MTLGELLNLLRAPRRWMPREEWDALVRGEKCSMCEQAGLVENRYSFLVAQLETSDLRLAKNQYVRGKCTLIFREHATELHELAPDKQAALMRDLARAGAAIARVFKPDKMNYQLLGNLVPHIHWHIVPRYWGDPAPGRPISPDSGRRLLKPEEYQRVIAELRAALESKT
jgi:diadenosine tetraphosphate (Ap4A) HIT family hydrolase